MKQNKVMRNHRFHPTLIEKMNEISDEIGCSRTFIIEQALDMFIVEYEKLGYVPEISEKRLSFMDM